MISRVINMKNKYVYALFATALSMSVAACASIPMTSLPRLSSLNPISMDFTQTRVAVRVQEGFRVEKGDVTLTMNVKNHVSGSEVEEAFILDVDQNAASSKHLNSAMKPGYNLYRFQIDPEDYDRMTQFQANLRNRVEQSKANGERGSNSFIVNVHTGGCLEKTANPFQKMKVTVFLQPTPQEDYFTFIKETNFDLPISENGGSIKRCD